MKYPREMLTPGERFGEFTILAPAPRDERSQLHWVCRCACGAERIVADRNLKSGAHKSCGCTRRKKTADRNRETAKHGHSGSNATPTYRTWHAMRSRCKNPNATAYERYGGRGIEVCARWDDFSAFLADMGERPKGKTLDRIDNDGNYEPGNCRWATPREQNLNRRVRSVQ